MLIRAVRAEDLPQVEAIYAHEVHEGTASFELTPPDLAEMSRRFESIVAAGLPYLVAEQGDRVLGYAYASPYRPRPAYRFTVENSVNVARDARRMGVGRGLLERLIAAAQAAGRRQMIAVIGDSAHAGSIGLHTACGFRLVGTLENVGFKFDRWLDTVIMQRPLT